MNRSLFLAIAITIALFVVFTTASSFDIDQLLEEYKYGYKIDSFTEENAKLAEVYDEIINDIEPLEFLSSQEQRKIMEAHGYEHSKWFNADGSLTAVTRDEMKLQAELAGAAYCVSKNAQSLADWACKACPSRIKMKSTTVWKFDGYELGVYVGFDDTDPNPANKVIRVVYRGSSNFSNWMANLAFAKVALGGNKGSVHTGFRTAYLQTRNDVVNKINSLRSLYGNHGVQVTGHSLGGAVALLAALDLKSGLSITNFANGLTHISSSLFPEDLPFTQTQLLSLGAETSLQTFPMSGPLITFGQPRVGDATFASWALTQLSSIGYTRVTHRHDPVPRVPTIAMGFAHANPYEIYFTNADGDLAYKVCSAGSAEDKTCIIGPLVNLSIGDHLWYAGTYLQQTEATCGRR